MTVKRNQILLRHSRVLGVPVGVLNMADALRQVKEWVETSDHARLVTFTNVHMVVEAYIRPVFHTILGRMDLNCPDGSPIFWILKHRHGRRVSKVSGPEFMPQFCQMSVEPGYKHFLFGGADGVAEEAAKTLEQTYPGIQIAGHLAPPFRAMNAEETQLMIDTINQSGAQVLWVCLGCPKQELWMNEMRDHLNVKVILAVGQALDILAGRTGRAPAILRNAGLEWAYRLCKEPRRLWKRYLVTNLLFIALITRETMMHQLHWGIRRPIQRDESV